MTTLTTAILPKTKTVRTRSADGTARVRPHPEFIRSRMPLPALRASVNLTMHGYGQPKPLMALPGEHARKNNREKPLKY
jgi:hypothetical protein